MIIAATGGNTCKPGKFSIENIMEKGMPIVYPSGPDFGIKESKSYVLMLLFLSVLSANLVRCF